MVMLCSCAQWSCYALVLNGCCIITYVWTHSIPFSIYPVPQNSDFLKEIRVIAGLSTKLCIKDCDLFSNMQDLHIQFKDFVVIFIQDALLHLGLCHSHFTCLRRVTLMMIYCNYSKFEDYLAKI